MKLLLKKYISVIIMFLLLSIFFTSNLYMPTASIIQIILCIVFALLISIFISATLKFLLYILHKAHERK